jgi:hypothetical protein
MEFKERETSFQLTTAALSDFYNAGSCGPGY